MTTATEKQGHIGDIHKKTLPELRELLERQEKLLRKQTFLQTLPDKGTKVKNFAETLRKLIAHQEEVETTTSNLERVGLLGSEPPIQSTNDQQVEDIASKIPKRDIVQLRGDNPSEMDVSDQLSACLERVTLSSHQHEVRGGDNKFINSYERVVKLANEKPAKRVFKPNSSLKISKLEDLPDAYKFRSAHNQAKADLVEQAEAEPVIDCDESSTTCSEIKDTCPSVSQVREESAVCIPDYKHDKCVLISVEESVQLVEEQRKKHEELQTRQAAERLANRLNIRLDDYNPEGTNMNYRVSAPDTDSDDEPEVEGYED